MEPMIRVEHISKTFRTGNGEVEAVKDISFSIEKERFSESSDYPAQERVRWFAV